MTGHDRIEVMLNSEPVAASGFVGNFETTIRCDETTQSVRHGALIVATGGQATTTEEYLYGQNDRVMRWHDIEKDPDRIRKAESVVFIQCVGSRDDQRPYCSRICCTTAVSQAIWVKELNPDAAVTILYRDIRTYGERELLYKKARQLGVIFIRYSLADKPQVRAVDDGLAVTVFEPVLGQRVEIAADYVNLATAIAPAAGEAISELYKITLNAERFFMEAHAKLRPVEFATDGIFLCGIAHYPQIPGRKHRPGHGRGKPGRHGPFAFGDRGGPDGIPNRHRRLHRVRALRGDLPLWRHRHGRGGGKRASGAQYRGFLQGVRPLRRILSPESHRHAPLQRRSDRRGRLFGGGLKTCPQREKSRVSGHQRQTGRLLNGHKPTEPEGR